MAPKLTAKYSKKERKAIKDASEARTKKRRLSRIDNSDVQPFVEAVFPQDKCEMQYEKTWPPQYTGRCKPAHPDYREQCFLVPSPQDKT
jgi:hypothetical protein